MDQPAHGACSLINVKTLNEVGGYDEQLQCHDGVDLWLKLIGKYKAKMLIYLYFYRQHGKSLSKNEKNFRTRDRILETYKK